MTLSKLEQHLLHDKRLTDRLLRDNVLSREALAKQIQQLPDLAAESVEIPAYEEPKAGSDDEPTFSAVEHQS